MKRFHLLDSIRGIALINMIVYHALWDVVYIFGINIAWYKSTGAHIWQQFICFTFILLSGFCHPLGRNKLKRGLTVVASSLLITVVTLVFMPENLILFGVLSLIGSSMLIMIPLDKLLRKINCRFGFVLFLGLFILAKNITYPELLHVNLFTAYLGFPPENFASADYFPLIPWIFLYLTGYFLFKIFKKENLLRFLSAPRIPLLQWLGRHSLIIYLLHQPVVYGILYLFFK